MSRVIKVSLNNDLRRIAVPAAELSFAELHRLVCERFGAGTLRLAFVDEDGDHVTLSCDEEVREAFAATAPPAPLRLHASLVAVVEKTPVSSSAPAAPAAAAPEAPQDVLGALLSAILPVLTARSNPEVAAALHGTVQQVVEAISSAAATAGGVAHNGVQCDGCGMFPIRDARFKCSICADFDLCEACEAKGVHPANHPMIKLRTPFTEVSCRVERAEVETDEETAAAAAHGRRHHHHARRPRQEKEEKEEETPEQKEERKMLKELVKMEAKMEAKQLAHEVKWGVGPDELGKGEARLLAKQAKYLEKDAQREAKLLEKQAKQMAKQAERQAVIAERQAKKASKAAVEAAAKAATAAAAAAAPAAEAEEDGVVVVEEEADAEVVVTPPAVVPEAVITPEEMALVKLGFELENAREALRHARGDVTAAANMLLG